MKFPAKSFLIGLIFTAGLSCQSGTRHLAEAQGTAPAYKSSAGELAPIQNGQNVSPAWLDFLNAKNQAKTSVLPDFSRAGYHQGETGIPESFPHLKVFNVVDFGAVPNDELSDQEAIQKAIQAAEANGGGVVFFPKGEFLVNTDPEKTCNIQITSSNIVLKGSGSGKDGTVVFMVNYMRKTGADLWGNKPMFTFKHKDLPYFTSTVSKRKYNTTTTLQNGAAKGSQAIEVADTSGFSKGDLIDIYTESNRPELVSAMVHGKETLARWGRIQKTGVAIQEMTRVTGVKSGVGKKGTILVSTPLSIDMSKEDTWTVAKIPSIEECGFEDIHFKGNFQDTFVHHKDYIHDGGWQGVQMVGATNSWVRRCVFTDVNGGVALEGDMNCSILLCTTKGNRGHGCFGTTFGSYNLIGCNAANEDRGGINGAHGAGASHLAHNNVIWRFKTTVRGADFHGTFPRNTLVDLYESDDMTRHGGNNNDLPNHLWGFVLWNFKQTGKSVDNYDFWKKDVKPGASYVDTVTIVDPIIVGFHGSNTTFKKDSVGYLESPGQAVYPESLYEAQLAARCGKLPAWVTKVKEEWAVLKK